MSYFNKFFGIYGEDDNFFFYILGKKVNFKKKKKLSIEELLNNQKNDIENLLKQTKNDILVKTKRLITISILHQKTFSEFKNSNFGKDIVMVGAGPTVNHFSPIKNAKYLALNRAITFNKVHFDYFFAIDNFGVKDYYKEIAEYPDCIKFIGDQNFHPEIMQIPESYIPTIKGDVRRYKTEINLMRSALTFDIDTEPLINFHTVALQAMQFILFTNPKKIFLVGTDCTLGIGNYFTKKTEQEVCIDHSLCNNVIKDWKTLKKFKDTYYPEIEIISVNPVGLRGLFKDVYTKSYLNEQGIEDFSEYEIIDEEINDK